MDVGANAGFTTVYFASKWESVAIASIEPMPNNVDVLRRNVDLNSVSSRIFQGAANISDGAVEIHCGSRDGRNSILGDHETAMERKLTVSCWTIPTLMKELNWDRIDLMKMDVEGYESVLLTQENQWLRHVRCICLEVHGEFGGGQLHALGIEYGYRVSQLSSGIWMLLKQ